MAEHQPWTGEQAAAIRAGGHVLLEANAGAGKTTTVVGAVLWRLGLDIGPEVDGRPIGPCPDGQRATLDQVAAITFTEKAAYDLKRKLRDELVEHAPHLLWDLDRAEIGTIHGFCAGALREHALRFGLDPAFTVFDDRESALAIEQLARELILERLAADHEGTIALVQKFTLEGRGEHGKGALDHLFTAFRSLRWHPDRWAREVEGHCVALLELATELRERWAAHLSEEHARDFDALILDLRDRLADPAMAPALAELRRRFRLLVIDEFQDTDEAQWEIARRIAAIGEDAVGPQLFLVGDPKQSVYRFRGADIAMWNRAAVAIPAEGRLRLTRNFRSTPPVVAYVNRVARPAMAETGKAVEGEQLPSRVQYLALEPARQETPLSAVQWLACAGKVDDRRAAEGAMVAATIRRLVEEGRCRYRDVAILMRTRLSVGFVTDALDAAAVPYYLAGDAGLTGRLEVLDILTLLRLLENPLDDLTAFAFLRSPFVGLRDEVIARIRMGAMDVSLLDAARRFVGDGSWFAAPEHAAIADVERGALAAALQAADELSALRSRVPLHRLVDEAVERLGYRLHLLLRPQSESRLANLERFIGLLEGYRHHTVGTFLELWARWEDRDLGVPQAPLYSRSDDVVTIGTVHSAKGLEWPVVFVVDTDGTLRDRATGSVIADRELGPALIPKQEERDPRQDRIAGREKAEEQAEEARLVYVALTRAMDRLYVAGPDKGAKGVAKWLAAGRDGTVGVVAAAPQVAAPALPPEPEPAWLGGVQEGGATSPLVAAVPAGPMRWARSASELMTRLRDGPGWRARYVHGVIRPYEFAPGPAGPASGGDRAPAAAARQRGDVIHGVLERIREEAELADLLDVVVEALDAPELEEHYGRGGLLRAALEEELRRIVTGDEWRCYVAGEHWRELGFVHFRRRRRWRVGAFDLFRLDEGRPLVVDFKTSRIAAEAVERVAAHYAAQVAVYRAAAAAAVGRPAEVRLHFTVPGVVWKRD